MANSFSAYDYLVLVLVLAISIFIGLFQGLPSGFFKTIKRKLFKNTNRNIVPENTNEECELKDVKENETDKNENSMNEYLIANKEIHLLPVACSILATLFSTNTLIGMPAEVYQYGMQLNVRIIPDTIACLLSAYVFLPILGRLNLVTMNEYFQLRFNSKTVRIIGIVSYCVQLMIWNGMIIYGAGTSLSPVTGLNVYWTMTILGLVTTTYTALGGIRGVIWSDVFQLFVMLSSLIFIIIKGSHDVGGVAKVWKIASDGGRINFFDFRPSPFIRQTFWSIFIGNLVTSTVEYNMDQSVIQRFAASKTVKNAQYSMLITGFGSAFIIFASGFVGLVIYATYADCDPLSIPDMTSLDDVNQLLAYYTTDKLHYLPGISGFIIGGLVSAAISSVSSMLNGMVAIIWHDCFKHVLYFQKLSDAKTLIFAKLLVVVLGVASISLSFMFDAIGGNLIQLGYILDGAITPPIALLFIMGSCFYFVNSIGAIVGSGVALIVGLWMLIGETVYAPEYLTLPLECNSMNVTFSNVSHSGEAINVSGYGIFHSLSFHLYLFFVILVGAIFGLIVSLATGGLKNVIPNNLVIFNKNLNKVSVTRF